MDTYNPLNPLNNSCHEIEIEISALEARRVRLMRVLEEPDLPESTRTRVLREIGQIDTQLILLRQQLEICQATFAIVGVEKTQGIQYFYFNGQGSGYADDNSLPLIALRTLILRVYINFNSGRFPDPVRRLVNGRITLDRFAPNGSFRRIRSLSSSNGPVVARPATAIDRGNVNHTLNFRLDPVDCQGHLGVTIEIFEQDPDTDPTGVFSGSYKLNKPDSLNVANSGSQPLAAFTKVEYCRFENVPAFRVRAILVHYVFGNYDLPAPTALDFLKTFEYTTKTYPSARIEFGDFTEIDFDQDLSRPGGGCGPAWGTLLDLLRDMAGDDNAVFIALIPRGILNLSVGGCGGGGHAATINGSFTALAQEIGHAFGRRHAPAGDPPGPDPNYPTYNGYPSGSIGEFGFDMFKSKVKDPASTYDFMSYAGPQWISPYTYLGIKSAMQDRFGDRLVDDEEMVLRETLFLSFCIKRDSNSVEVHPSFHFPTKNKSLNYLPQSDIICELLDENNEVLIFHRCHQNNPHLDPQSPCICYQENIRWTPEARRIRFARNSETLYVHQIEDSTMTLELQTKSINHQNKPFDLHWTQGYERKKNTYMVRYSNDAGNSWRIIAANLKDPKWIVKPDLLPGGKECLLQILASSGIRTSMTQSEYFKVDSKKRIAIIVHPAANEELETGQELLFQGISFSPDFGSCDMEEAVWTSNIDGLIGTGFDFMRNNLTTGYHLITFTIPDGMGTVATTTISLKIK